MKNLLSNPARDAAPAPLRWGILGASHIASEWMIPAIRAGGLGEVVAVLSSDATRAAKFAAANGIPKHGTDRAAFFADEAIDAVYVCTTNERHAPDTIEGAAAGKHVLCEKPMALDEQSALTMIDACRLAGVVLAINHHMRCMETHRAIREIVRGGVLGELRLVRILFGLGLPEDAKRWRLQEPAAGGGTLFDLGVHEVDLLRFLFDGDIERIHCMTDSGASKSSAEHTTLLNVRMKSGLLVSTAESFTTPAARTSLEIHGSAGSLVAQDVMLQAGIGRLRLSIDGKPQDIPVQPASHYLRVVREFSAAVRGEGRPAASGEDGFLSLLAILKAKESAVAGHCIPLRPPPLFQGNNA